MVPYFYLCYNIRGLLNPDFNPYWSQLVRVPNSSVRMTFAIEPSIILLIPTDFLAKGSVLTRTGRPQVVEFMLLAVARHRESGYYK